MNFIIYIIGVILTLLILFKISNINENFKDIINDDKNIAILILIGVPMLSWIGVFILVSAYNKENNHQ